MCVLFIFKGVHYESEDPCPADYEWLVHSTLPTNVPGGHTWSASMSDPCKYPDHAQA